MTASRLEPGPLGARDVADKVGIGGYLVTFDPGSRSPALTVWQKRLALRAPGCEAVTWHVVDVVRVRAGGSADDHLRRALKLAAALKPQGSKMWRTISAFVSEYPEARMAGKSKGSANDLIPMALVIGALAVELGVPSEMCAVLLPSEWAATTPKATSGDPRKEVRGARIWAALTPEEQELVIRLDLLQHDAFDSMGVGLYVTRRVERGITVKRHRRS